MKNIILTVLIVTSFGVLAKTSSQQQADVALKKWSTGLSQYLINHDDVDLSMIGLHRKAILYRHSDIDIEDIEIYDLMDQVHDLIKHEKLDVQSLMLAENICTMTRLKESCQMNIVLKQLIQSEPDNLATYIAALNRATSENNDSEIMELLKKMANTKFSNIYFVNSKKLDNAIDNYQEKIKPLRTKEIVSLNEITETNGLSKSMLQYITDNPEIFYTFMEKVTYKLMKPIPSYRYLTDICKNNKQYYSLCLQIANIMHKNSNTMITKLLGMRLQSELLELQGNKIAADKAKLDDELFKAEYKCILDAYAAGEYSLDTSLDSQSYTVVSNIEREQGEYAALIKMAEINFQRLLARGDEQALDPSLCFIKGLTIATKSNP